MTPASELIFTPPMTSELPYFVKIISSEYEKIKSLNPRFSVRAYARKLKINPATLSSILKGKRKVPKKHALEIAEILQLSPSNTNRFLKSLKAYSFSENEPQIKEPTEVKSLLHFETHKAMIEEWEYYAVLPLLEIKNQWSSSKIAKRLNLPLERIEVVLRNLTQLQFIKKQSDGYVLNSTGGVRTSEDIPSQSLVLGHENELKLAIQKLRSSHYSVRDYSSRTMPIDKKNIPEAKKLIRKFRQELSDLLEDGEPSEVYMLSVQLFPLTEPEI